MRNTSSGGGFFTPTIRTCIVCGKQFTLKPYYNHVRKTCSDECRYELVGNKFARRTTRNCLNCGKEFVIIPSSKKTLCSLLCRIAYMGKRFSGASNPNWKLTKTLRPSNKKSLRRHIIARDQVCQDCGSSKNLHVHHVDSNPQNNDESNLILLCKPCHATRHEKLGESNLIKLVLVNRTYHHVPDRPCTICGKMFTPKHSDDVCCSGQCARVQSGVTRRKSKQT